MRGKVPGGRKGAIRPEDVQDLSQDAFNPREHIIIPEAQHSIPFTLKPTIAVAVAFTLQMLTAIDFDDQHRFQARKVDNVRSDRDLAAKSPICKLAPAQSIPETLLRVRHPGA